MGDGKLRPEFGTVMHKVRALRESMPADQALVLVRALAEPTHGKQTKMRQVVPQLGQVLLAQHPRLSLVSRVERRTGIVHRAFLFSQDRHNVSLTGFTVWAAKLLFPAKEWESKMPRDSDSNPVRPWPEIVAEISKEKDPEKMVILLHELDRAMTEQGATEIARRQV